MAKSITLVIPGLFDNLPDPVPRLPALETLLARADYRDDLPVGYERTLMHLFGLPQSPEHDVPEGALGRYAQTGERPDGIWLCAAPVHLFADQSRVYLNSIDEATLSEAEAAQLIAELNQIYQEDGWEFVQHTSTRWYLRVPEKPSILTTPLREVDGKPIHDKLPQGDDALQWHRVLNEMQMLLHASPVNQVRQEGGVLPVNGVWLWGSGVLPEVTATEQWQSICSDEPSSLGLALLKRVTIHNFPANVDLCLEGVSEGDQLVVTDFLVANGVEHNLEQMEANWFAPFYAALKSGRLDSVNILAGDARQWCLSRRSLLRFWRRTRSMHKYKKSS